MIISVSIISWAALRSGQTLSEFLAALTPEREIEIMERYNCWRVEHGLSEVGALQPRKECWKHKCCEEFESHALSNMEMWKALTNKHNVKDP